MVYVLRGKWQALLVAALVPGRRWLADLVMAVNQGDRIGAGLLSEKEAVETPE